MCKSNQDILCGLCFLAISAAFALQMQELEDVTRVFPAALLTVIALGGVWFVGKGIYLKRRDNTSCETESVAWKKVAIIAAIALIYAVLLSILGFFVSTAAFIFCTSMILGDKNKGILHLAKVSTLYSLIFCILIWLSFVKLLNVPTPTGLFF